MRSIAFVTLALLFSSITARCDECAEGARQSVQYWFWDDVRTYIEGSASAEEIAAHYSKYEFEPWPLAMYPTAKARKAGLLAQERIIASFRQKLDPTDTTSLEALFARTAKMPPVLGRDARKAYRKRLRAWRDIWTFLDTVFTRLGMRLWTFLTPVSCSPFPGHLGCIPALEQVIHWMHPTASQEDFTITQLGLLEDVMLDPEYTPGAAIAAGTVMKRVERLERGEDPGLDSSDLFSDLVAGYISAGKSPEEARTRALDLLGVYGSRGAATYSFFTLADKNTYPVLAALSYLASAASYLDAFRQGNRYYSLPPTFTATCDLGKPYHFWLSAYLTRSLMRLKFSAAAAVTATHAAGSTYEFASEWRSPSRVISEPAFSLGNDLIRMNIAANDAGAFWAVDPEAVFSLDVAFEHMKNQTLPVPPRTLTKAEKLCTWNLIACARNWNRVIAPHTLVQDWLQ